MLAKYTTVDLQVTTIHLSSWMGSNKRGHDCVVGGERNAPANVVGRRARNETAVDLVGETAIGHVAIGVRIRRTEVKVATFRDQHFIGNC